MNATEILMDEHRVIERVLDALESAANLATQGGQIRPGFFIDASDFIKGFADGCHHMKEEGVLFKATYIESNKSIFDKEAFIKAFSAEAYAKYTKTTAVFSVKVTSK